MPHVGSCGGSSRSAEGKPARITTDLHPAYRRAIRWIIGRKAWHRTTQYLNNYTEQSHRGREAALLPDARLRELPVSVTLLCRLRCAETVFSESDIAAKLTSRSPSSDDSSSRAGVR